MTYQTPSLLSLVDPLWLARLFLASWPWYADLQLLGFAVFPLIFTICTRLRDRGYAMAKALGLILTCYLTLLVVHLLPPLPLAIGFKRASVAGPAVFLAVLSAIALARRWREFADYFRRNARTILIYEMVFLVSFVFMLGVRAAVPQITYLISDSAAEKFTDFAILNGLLASDYYPPHSTWAGGLTMNYYYFGHFLWACMIKLNGIRPEIGFNLALASIFALVCVQSLGLGYNLTRRWGWAFMSMFLIVLASNVDGFLQLVGLFFQRREEILFDRPWYLGYDFWRSSRAVENTINEFPMFSFVLGDLHAHLSSLIILLAGLGLALQMRANAQKGRSLLRYEVSHVGELFLCCLIAGALYAANSWDAATYGLIIALVLWTCATVGPADGELCEAAGARQNRIMSSVLRAVEALLLSAVLVVAGTKVLFAPFDRNFEPPIKPHMMVSGRWPFMEIADWPIRIVSPDNRSNTIEFMSHWALLLAAPLCLALWLLLRHLRAKRISGGNTGASDERFWGITALSAATILLLRVAWASWVAAVCFIAACALICLLIRGIRQPAIRLLTALLLVFSVVSWFCELFYLDDIYDGPIERINTVFKLYYGMWPAMALASVLALSRIVRYAPRHIRRQRAAWITAIMLLIGGVYPVVATMQRVGGGGPNPKAVSARDALDGMRYLKLMHPDDYAAIQWIRSNIPGGARLLEAAGTQYTYSGRISTNTGRSSLAGWLYHEWAWRSRSDEWTDERDRRTTVTSTIYELSDATQAHDLLTANGIEYVIVGDQEHGNYPLLNEDKFALISDPVFNSGATTIYRVKDNARKNALRQPQMYPSATR
ncbi:MAG: DUF2298 domain-containing protein [bacterium]|nr:DUF2298 domain-containing protein [Candidatus Sumerlaeota bacterium]